VKRGGGLCLASTAPVRDAKTPHLWNQHARHPFVAGLSSWRNQSFAIICRGRQVVGPFAQGRDAAALSFLKCERFLKPREEPARAWDSVRERRLTHGNRQKQGEADTQPAVVKRTSHSGTVLLRFHPPSIQATTNIVTELIAPLKTAIQGHNQDARISQLRAPSSGDG